MMMMMVMMGLVFLSVSQPMSMVLMMIVVTLFYSMLVYVKILTFWYSFILMMVVISGVLVVFTYMASMVPNESFESNWMVVMMAFFLWTSMLSDQWSLDESGSSLKLWDKSILFMNIYLVMFLMVIMFLVIWVSNWSKGSVKL